MVFCNNDSNDKYYGCIDGHNPYFNRWFSAILPVYIYYNDIDGHNPYFNRWFSAIQRNTGTKQNLCPSQSLF